MTNFANELGPEGITLQSADVEAAIKALKRCSLYDYTHTRGKSYVITKEGMIIPWSYLVTGSDEAFEQAENKRSVHVIKTSTSPDESDAQAIRTIHASFSTLTKPEQPVRLTKMHIDLQEARILSIPGYDEDLMFLRIFFDTDITHGRYTLNLITLEQVRFSLEIIPADDGYTIKHHTGVNQSAIITDKNDYSKFAAITTYALGTLATELAAVSEYCKYWHQVKDTKPLTQ